MDGVQLPQGYNHFEEAVYFVPFSSQKFLVLILSTLERWKAGIPSITNLATTATLTTVKNKTPTGLFPGKSGATVFNNKIELFEKTEDQGPGVFRLLGFRLWKTSEMRAFDNK